MALCEGEQPVTGPEMCNESPNNHVFIFSWAIDLSEKEAHGQVIYSRARGARCMFMTGNCHKIPLVSLSMKLW